MKRRNLLKGTAAVLAASSLPATPLFAQEKRLRGAWWGSQERTERTLDVGELYTEQTGVVFEGEGAGWADYWPRLSTQVAGGNPPDIVQQNYSTISEWARQGTLLPLDDYLGSGLDLSDFDPVQVEAATVDGQLYGVSIGYAAFAMVANSKSWEEAGQTLPDLGTTWEEFGRRAAAVTEAVGRPDYYGTQDGSGVVGALQSWVRQRGKDLYTVDGKLGYGLAEATDWFRMWQQFREAGACPPADIQALDQLNIETSMLTLGHAATCFGYANQLVGYQAVNSDPLELVPPPMLDGDESHGVFMQPAQFFSVTSASEFKDQAVDFINFFVRDPEAALILGVERGMPAAAAIRKVLTPHLDAGSQQMAAYLELVGPVGGSMPPPPPAGSTEMNAILKRTSEEVAFGMKSPEEGAETLLDEAERVLV